MEVKIIKKTSKGLRVGVVDSNKKALVPLHHLSDYKTIAQAKFNLLEIGSTQHAVVICSKPAMMTMKEDFLSYVRGSADLPSKVSELVIDQVLPGFVSEVDGEHVTVTLPGGLAGQCMVKSSPEASSTQQHYYVGQSVTAKVEDLHAKDGKLAISLQPSQLYSRESNQIVRFFKGMESLSEYIPKELTVKVGGVVDVKRITDGATGKCVVEKGELAEYSGRFVNVKETKTGSAVILFIDHSTKQLLLTNNMHVLHRYSQASKHNKTSHDLTLRCSVLYVNDDVTIGYVITSNKKSKNRGRLIFMATYPHRNLVGNRKYDDVSVGNEIEVTTSYTMPGQILLCQKRCAVTEKDSDAPVQNPAASSSAPLNTSLNTSPPQKPSVLAIDRSFKSLNAMFKSKPKTKEVEFRVTSVGPTHLICDVTSGKDGKPKTGILHAYELAKEPKHNSLAMAGFKCGHTLRGYVIGCGEEVLDSSADQVHLELSQRAKTHRVKTEFPSGDYPVGKKVVAYVVSYNDNGKYFEAEVAHGVKGRIADYLVTPRPEKMKKANFIGKALVCRVVRSTNPLQLRAQATVVDGVTGKNTEVKKGCIITGKVRKVMFDTLLVKTITGTGKAHVTDLVDELVDHPMEKFKENQFVRCYVLDRPPMAMMQLSLKKSHTCLTDSRDLTSVDVTSLSGGELLYGYVKSVTEHGVFISLSHSLDALAIFKSLPYHLTSMEDAKRVLYPGRLVMCYVTDVDEGKVRVSLLKKHTGQGLAEPPRKRVADTPSGPPTKIRRVTELTKDKIIKLILQAPTDKKIEIKCVSSSPDDVNDDPGLNWNDDVSAAMGAPTSDYESDMEENEKAKQLNRKQKLALAEAEEMAVRKREIELMELKAPQSSAEWERLMTSEPDNSMLWIRYMAFHIHATEVEQARAVAEKALRTINFRKETEKLNVWVSLLNLENMYGSDVTMEQTLRRALNENEQRNVLRHLVTIYTQAGKLDKAKETHERAIKKFRYDKDTWLAYMRHLMVDHKQENIQDVLARCLKSVGKQHHMEIISRTAQMEFKFGDVERGRTIFENLLSSFPKRTDVWSMYIDKLVQLERIDEAREIFNRVTSSSLSSKKIASFYKRFVEFEVNHGDTATINEAKKKAIEYLNTSAK